jgi:hypothetical protein
MQTAFCLPTQFEIGTQIHLPNLFIHGELFGCSRFEDTPFEEQVSTVGDEEGFVHVVVGDEDADLFLTEALKLWSGYPLRRWGQRRQKAHRAV